MRTVALVGGAAICSVVLMIWGFIFWTISPLPMMAMDSHETLASVVTSMQRAELPAGVYVYPPTEHGEPRGAFMELFYVPDVEYMASSVFIQGFIHFFGVALLAGMILRGVVSALPGYGSRVAFVSMLGILSAFAIHFSNPIWFHYPWRFAFMVATYDVVMFLLVGLIMGALVRPAEPEVAASPGDLE